MAACTSWLGCWNMLNDDSNGMVPIVIGRSTAKENAMPDGSTVNWQERFHLMS